MSEDHELLDRFYRGDDGALAELYCRWYPRMVAYFRRHGAGGDSEDLAEEVFVRILGTRAKGGSPFNPNMGSFAGWIYRIAHNLLADRMRRRGRIVEVAELPVPAIGPGQEAGVILEQCLQALEPRKREVILLVELEGLSYEEAASVLAVNPTTLNNWLYQARQQLRACMSNSGR